MKDVASINRNFLLQAREAAKKPEGLLLTGVAPSMLKRISELSVDDIESLATTLPVSAFSIRFNEAELDRILATQRPGLYAVSVLSQRR